MESTPQVHACDCASPRVDVHCRAGDGRTKSVYWVRCASCGRTGDDGPTERDAVVAWNGAFAAGPAPA